LIANDVKGKTAVSFVQKIWPLLNILLTISLLGLGLWYLIDGVGLAAVGEAFNTSSSGYILLSLLIVLVMNLAKTWRWQILFATQSDPPPFAALFWAIMLGQYVNLVVPFLRLGEVARIYVLHKQNQTGSAWTLGTLVVEKVLDLVVLALTLLIVVPFMALPDYINHPGLQLGIMSAILLVGLYTLAYQTKLIIAICQFFIRWLPMNWAQKVMGYIIQGLESFATLRDKRTSLALLGTSILVGVTAVLTPYILFVAFDLPLSLAQAAIIHVVVMIALTPPSTPGKIGVFDGAAAFSLLWFGIESQAAIAGYTITYHLVAVLPPVLLGMVAASRTNWRWKQMPK
jgi:glycosyltransferase 2 family protein